MTKPLPCPFCGKDAKIVRRSDDKIQGSRVECSNWENCVVQSATDWFRTDEEVIARWNTRTRSAHE